MYEVDLTGSTLLLFGNEGEGLEQELDLEVDLQVSVPMRRQVDSLNVAAAAALIIYEARRQHLKKRRSKNRSQRSRHPSRKGETS